MNDLIVELTAEDTLRNDLPRELSLDELALVGGGTIHDLVTLSRP